MFMSVYPGCVEASHMHERPTDVQEVSSPGTAVIDGCKLLCECWESNPGPPQEQQVLLTPEPSP